MNRGVIFLMVGMLCLWPLSTYAGQPPTPEVFQATQAPPSSSAFADQPDEGKVLGDVLTPVQLDGLRMLLTPFPQEEFDATDDRKSADASLGVTYCGFHVNGRTTGRIPSQPR